MVSSVPMAERGRASLFRKNAAVEVPDPGADERSYRDCQRAEKDNAPQPKVNEYATTPRNEASQSKSARAAEIESDLESTCEGDERLAFAALQRELSKAKEKLKRKDEQVANLMEIRRKIETEMQDLTASLFQEAHAMVREANVKRVSAEKALAESAMKVDVLSAQVSAMKALLITPMPTPTTNQRHRHRRFYSSDDSTFGREAREDAADGQAEVLTDNRESDACGHPSPADCRAAPNDADDRHEVDPTVFGEFCSWKDDPSLERSDRFIERIYRDDINQCLDFQNEALVARIRDAVRSDQIYIEAVDKAKSQFQRKCSLLQTDRMCPYRMRLADEDEWFYISHICRNRIIAACNLFSYLRYIRKGIVKSSAEDAYWEIVRLRKEMSMARFGLPACV